MNQGRRSRCNLLRRRSPPRIRLEHRSRCSLPRSQRPIHTRQVSRCCRNRRQTQPNVARVKLIIAVAVRRAGGEFAGVDQAVAIAVAIALVGNEVVIAVLAVALLNIQIVGHTVGIAVSQNLKVIDILFAVECRGIGNMGAIFFGDDLVVVTQLRLIGIS